MAPATPHVLEAGSVGWVRPRRLRDAASLQSPSRVPRTEPQNSVPDGHPALSSSPCGGDVAAPRSDGNSENIPETPSPPVPACDRVSEAALSSPSVTQGKQLTQLVLITQLSSQLPNTLA